MVQDANTITDACPASTKRLRFRETVPVDETLDLDWVYLGKREIVAVKPYWTIFKTSDASVRVINANMNQTSGCLLINGAVGSCSSPNIMAITVPPPPPPPPPIGAIVGGVVGGIAVLAAVGGGFYYSKRKRQQQATKAAATTDYNSNGKDSISNPDMYEKPPVINTSTTNLTESSTAGPTTLVNPEITPKPEVSEALARSASTEELLSSTKVFSMLAGETAKEVTYVDVQRGSMAIGSFEPRSWDEMAVKTGGE